MAHREVILSVLSLVSTVGTISAVASAVLVVGRWHAVLCAWSSVWRTLLPVHVVVDYFVGRMVVGE